MSATPSISIPAGSWILVTGANGYIASHVIKQLLERGYRVRGTVRDVKRTSWLKDDVFKSYSASGHFELFEADLATPGSLKSAVRGMSGIVHLATIQNFDPDPEKVVPPVVAGTTDILEAAAEEPGIKQFVYTSSAAANVLPMPGIVKHLDRRSWNDEAVQMAYAAKPPYEPRQGFLTYMASKTEAEKAVWRFRDEHRPGFNVNAVSPFTAMGKVLQKGALTSTATWVVSLWEGVLTDGMKAVQAAYHISVEDIALMHVIALLDPTLDGERLYAWAEKCNWNMVLEVMRRLFPDRVFMDSIPNLPLLDITVPQDVEMALLKKWAGRDGWIGLEECVRDTLVGTVV